MLQTIIIVLRKLEELKKKQHAKLMFLDKTMAFLKEENKCTVHSCK